MTRRETDLVEREEAADESRIMKQMQANQPINMTRTIDPDIDVAFSNKYSAVCAVCQSRLTGSIAVLQMGYRTAGVTRPTLHLSRMQAQSVGISLRTVGVCAASSARWMGLLTSPISMASMLWVTSPRRTTGQMCCWRRWLCVRCSYH